ncbi:winged helix-turn-helix transcriptional regulator [Mycoplasmatota bacterium]|nr:winged helix-turn-helix transcriptional regulator [Mycoplasmatota bacterium]
MNEVEIFKLLSDENRFKIFTLLLFVELCICDLEKFLNMKQANVSKHMMKFKKLNIVNTRKEAQWVYYCLSEEFIKKNYHLINFIKDKVLKNKEYCVLINSLNEKQNCKV